MTALATPRMDLSSVDESAVIASICRESLWEFVKEFWDVVTEEPLIQNWHMPFLCRQLEEVAERVFLRQKKKHDLLINISPGTSKSTIVSVMFPAWCWTRAPWVQVICGSYAESLSEFLATKSRDIITSEKYQKCFPQIVLRRDSLGKSFFQNTRGGWRYSGGCGGSVTGKHAHIIIIDDPVDPKRAISAADVKTANDWLTHTIPKRKVSHDNTVSIMIMQRLSEDDPSALWLGWKAKGVKIKHICLPAELTEQVRPRRLRRLYEDGLFDPKRFSRAVLQQNKMQGPWTYQSQFLQAPVPPGGGLFKVSRLSYETVDYSNGRWQLVRYWDKAGTEGDGAYTVGVLMGRDPNGLFWVLDVVRGQWEPADRERVIRQTAVRDGRNVFIRIEQEPGSGGKESAEATIRNLAGFRVAADRPTGDKFKRADPYAAQVNAGNVRIRKAEWNQEYVEELRGFGPKAPYVDQVDASSGAFSFLAGRVIKIGVF